MTDETVESKRAEMKRAVRYRSGVNDIGGVYLGGLASARIVSLLGGRYGKDSMLPLIDKASDKQIEAVWAYSGFQWILKHYRAGGSKLFKYKVVAVEID